MQVSSIPFLNGSGELRALIRSHNWGPASLGPPEIWPQSFKNIVSFGLDSKFPMFFTWGEKLACVYNDAYSEILGNKHPWALGRPFEEVWPDIWDDVRPLVERALTGESVYLENLPLTMYRKGYAEPVWFTFTYSPIRDDAGIVRGMCCTCVETTQQVLAERGRIAENERLRSLFHQAPGMMAVLRGPEHVFELINNAYMQLVGERPQVGMPVREALPELEGQGFFELLDKVYTSGEPYVGRSVPIKLRRTHSGELEERFVDFVYQPICDNAGHITGIFLEGSDVTDAVKAMQALRESEARLRELANTIPHQAWMANSDGTIHWCNERWYAYSGGSREAALGTGWQNVIHPDDLEMVGNKWQESITTGKPYEATVRTRDKYGEYRTFSVRAAPLRDTSGNIIQWFGTNTDVTEIHRAQQELMAASRRKDDFLAMLAHELRNPLAPINTAAELLKLASLDTERLRQTSDIITRQVAHMTELVDDLLDVSRVTRGLITLQEEPLNLKTILSEAIEQVSPLIEAKHHHLTTHAPDDALFVKGDCTRLIQVITNILNNAAKYTPEYGHITVRLTANQELVEVAIQDTGIGISAELLPHVFDLFTQSERTADRAQGGLGLGLALVKSLVEMHGGTVTARSAGVGKGSEFIVRLSRLAETPVRPTSSGSNAAPVYAGNAIRIMVVDDNIDAAQTLAMLLQALGHIVTVEYSAQRALERAKREAPSILFLDIGLPEMDGNELAKRLRAMPETANATLVAITGYGQQEDKERTKQAGFNHHLVKPVQLNDVLNLIQTLLTN